jgi:hypothetical protein
MLTFRVIIASAAALWCVAGITAGIVRTIQETAPAPAAESPAPVLVEILAKADRLPLVPARTVAERWYTPPPPERADELEIEPQMEPRKLTRHSRHLDHPRDVCARHGLRKVITRGGRSWRCRR